MSRAKKVEKRCFFCCESVFLIVNPQAFVRDPDGYYIEFANCDSLERFIQTKMAEGEKDWNLNKAKSVLKASKQLKKVATQSKLKLLTRSLSRELSLVRGTPLMTSHS